MMSRSQLGYLPGLDGLRAYAVIAVMLYHANYPVAGGYLGVESFFVLSGFLITALLLSEWQDDERIALLRFWQRRARRLLPALLVVLIGTLVLSAVFVPSEVPSVAADSIAALLYMMNWKLVLGQQSYFDALDRPALLQHLWSLAVEEQFYLLWPLLFFIGMRLLRWPGFLIVVLSGALSSTLLMITLYEPGSDPSRIYYGTDTRISAMLIGGALAIIRQRGFLDRLHGWVIELMGMCALVGLLGAYVWLYEQHPLLYRGGFQVVALLTVLVIMGAISPNTSILPRLLEFTPLRWIGMRSYSLYLWHWPLFLLTRPGVDIPWSGWHVDVARFGLVVALAAASYRFIEHPIRTHGVVGAWWMLRGAAHRTAPWQVPQLRLRKVTASLLIIVVIGMNGIVRNQPDRDVSPIQAPLADSASLPAAFSKGDNTSISATKATPRPISPTPVVPTLEQALTSELQRLLDDVVSDGFVPGAVASVSVPGYAPWTGASGLADRAERRVMEPHTPVRIGSVSKLFTAVVILQLVEEGALSLDMPIGTWLPNSVPDAEQITVRNLLQHTSGLYDYLEDRIFVGEAQRQPDYVWQPHELVAYATRFPSTGRGRWDYSSTNYVLLGMLIEEVTGRSLAYEIRRRIFEPLDMQQAAFLPQEPIPELMAHGYSRGTDITGVSMSFAFATASIVMTAEDLQQFGRALFTEDLLCPATHDMMMQFVSGRGNYDMPALEYGLGIMKNRLPLSADINSQLPAEEAGLVLGHIGGYSGFRSALWYAPRSNIVIAVGLNQAHTDPNDLAAAILDQVLSHMGQPQLVDSPERSGPCDLPRNGYRQPNKG